MAQIAQPLIIIIAHASKTAAGMVLASTISAFVILVGLDFLVTFNVALVILSEFLVKSIAVVMVFAAMKRLVLVIWAGLAPIAPLWRVHLIAMTMAIVVTARVFVILVF